MEKERGPGTTSQNEANVYADVYLLLIGGMIVSNVLFGAGIVIALLHPAYVPLTTQWVRVHSQWSNVIHGLAAGDPISLMLLATMLLILTPIARVVVSIAAFATDRDYKFVVITSIVMLIMMLTVGPGLLGLQ